MLVCYGFFGFMRCENSNFVIIVIDELLDDLHFFVAVVVSDGQKSWEVKYFEIVTKRKFKSNECYSTVSSEYALITFDI